MLSNFTTSAGSTSATAQQTLPGDLPQLKAEGDFAVIDGPESVNMDHQEVFAEVPYMQSSLSKADNPADALVKYRIIYFKYLDH